LSSTNLPLFDKIVSDINARIIGHKSISNDLNSITQLKISSNFVKELIGVKNLVDIFEEKYKPELCNAIVTINNINNITFAELTPAGEEFDVNTLSWFIIWGLNKFGNVLWKDKTSSVFHLGSPEFSKFINSTLLQNQK
jgi:hypothetical protein